tara:strand:+ start:307 stop:2634 length:2328 start_codon:yes stop_codon:yes gene_type:complete
MNSPLEELIDDFGDIDSIPDDELERVGYFRDSMGKITSVNDDFEPREYNDYGEELDDNELGQDYSGLPELPSQYQGDLKQAKDKERTSIEERFNTAVNGIVGSYLSPEQKRNILEKSREVADKNAHQRVVYINPEPRDLEPYDWIEFLEAGNEFLIGGSKKKLEQIIFDRVASVVENKKALTYDGVSFDPEIFTRVKDEISERFYDEIVAREYSPSWRDDNAKLYSEFEAKWFPTRFAEGAPFTSWLVKRELSGESPTEFWGNGLYKLREEFIEKFKKILGAESLADTIYDTIAGWRLEGIASENSEAFDSVDAVPDCIVDFEASRNTSGTALAVLDTEYFNGYFSEEEFGENPQLRRTLRDIHHFETTGELFDESAIYSFLEKRSLPKGKREKAIQLAQFSKPYLDFVNAHSSGDLDYVTSMSGNSETHERLEELGVNTEVFYNGLPKKQFVVETTGEIINREQIRDENLKLYRVSLESIVSNDNVHNPQNLLSKIRSNLGDDVPESVEDDSLVEYLASLSEPDKIKKVITSSLEYASKSPNIRNPQVVGASLHHLRQVNKFFKGKVQDSDSNPSSVYGVEIRGKDPLWDVDIGNDGGCCIGLYGTDRDEDFVMEKYDENQLRRDIINGSFSSQEITENGVHMPFYLKDRATQFAHLYKGEDRVGMALLFAGENGEGEPVLLVNSLENSDRLREDPKVKEVRAETLRYIKDFGEKAGFKYTLMSAHDYNPAADLATDEFDNSIRKIHPNKKETFYSDALSDTGGLGGLNLWGRV